MSHQLRFRASPSVIPLKQVGTHPFQPLGSRAGLSRKSASVKKAARRARKAAQKVAISKAIAANELEFNFLSENLPPLPRIQDEHLAAAALDDSSVEHQQLAYLGDRLFAEAATMSLWNTCSSNGTLAIGAQKLTTNRTFSKIAKAYDLQTKLKGYKLKPIPVNSEKNLGSALEALMGAAYLDAWKYGKERAPLAWALQVLDVDRWEGFREYMSKLEEMQGRKRIYPIEAKGDIWPSVLREDRQSPGTSNTEGVNVYANVFHPSTHPSPSLFQKLVNFVYARNTKSTQFWPVLQGASPQTTHLSEHAVGDKKVSVPQPVSPLSSSHSKVADDNLHDTSQQRLKEVTSEISDLRRRLVKIEQTLGEKPARLKINEKPPSCNAASSTESNWEPTSIPFKSSHLPLLFQTPAIKFDRDFHTRIKNDLDKQGYDNYLKVFETVKDCLRIYSDSDLAVSIAAGHMLSNRSVSHVARFYRLSQPDGGPMLSQHAMARSFRHYLALLIRHAEDTNRPESTNAWFRELFNPDVWPTIEKIIMKAEKRRSGNNKDSNHEESSDTKTPEQTSASDVSADASETSVPPFPSAQPAQGGGDKADGETLSSDGAISDPGLSKGDRSQVRIDQSQSQSGWDKPDIYFDSSKLPPPVPDLSQHSDALYESMLSSSKLVSGANNTAFIAFLVKHLKSRGFKGPPLMGAVTGLSSFKSISHLAHSYDLAKDSAAKPISQAQAARVFRQYISILLQEKKFKRKERNHKWLKQVFSQEVWPGLVNYLEHPVPKLDNSHPTPPNTIVESADTVQPNLETEVQTSAHTHFKERDLLIYPDIALGSLPDSAVQDATPSNLHHEDLTDEVEETSAKPSKSRARRLRRRARLRDLHSNKAEDPSTLSSSPMPCGTVHQLVLPESTSDHQPMPTNDGITPVAESQQCARQSVPDPSAADGPSSENVSVPDTHDPIIIGNTAKNDILKSPTSTHYT